MGQNKDWEITYEVLQQAKLIWLAEFNLIFVNYHKYLITDASIGKQSRQTLKHLSSHFHRLSFTPDSFPSFFLVSTSRLHSKHLSSHLVNATDYSQSLRWGYKQSRRSWSACSDFSLPLLISHSFPVIWYGCSTGCSLCGACLLQHGLIHRPQSLLGSTCFSMASLWATAPSGIWRTS